MIGPGLRAVLALAGVFGAGLVCGVFLERHHSIAPHAQLHTAAAEEHERALRELRDIVGLDAEQIDTVNRILAEHQRDVDLHWEQLRPEVQEAMQRVHREIARHLRPEQRERYHVWLQHRRERHQQMARHREMAAEAESASESDVDPSPEEPPLP